jgi:hypothetical protein
LNTKVVKQVTLFNNAIGSKVFIHWFEHKLQGKSGKNSASVNSNEVPCVVWTSLGPLPRWVPGPTTRWAPGTTRLALHGTCWREAHYGGEVLE